MWKELAKVSLANPGDLMRSLGYAAGASVMKPGKHRPPTDDRFQIMEKWVQAALNVLLGVKLKIDGNLQGPARIALIRFQKERGLGAHGCIDEKTLRALEEEVGIAAPRDGTYEGTVPPLWMEDRKKPAPPPGKPPEKAKDKGPAKTLDEQRAEHVTQLLQREAEEAVRTVAFDREFVELELARLQRPGDAALRLEMAQWFDAARKSTEKAPAWLGKVAESARERPNDAVARLRQAWIEAHPLDRAKERGHDA
jgi:hypothetical protein